MIYRKILRYIVFLMIYFDISLIYRDISTIYWGHFFQISKKYTEISSNISPIYRDISKYIAIYRDMSLDISRYRDISVIFDKFADINSKTGKFFSNEEKKNILENQQKFSKTFSTHVETFYEEENFGATNFF